MTWQNTTWQDDMAWTPFDCDYCSDTGMIWCSESGQEDYCGCRIGQARAREDARHQDFEDRWENFQRSLLDDPIDYTN